MTSGYSDTLGADDPSSGVAAGREAVPAPPTVSVVICSNRPGGLHDAVASILANQTPAFELVVIAQGGDGTWADHELAPFRDDARLRIVYDAGHGLSRARNVALSETTGELVLFTDDDCTVAENWVHAHVQTYQERPDTMMVFGRVAPPDGYTWTDGMVPTFDPDDAAGTPRLRGRIALGIGANMSIRRVLTSRIGLFDERLGPGSLLQSGDDFDLALRASAAGALVVADGRPQAIHVGGVRGLGRPSRALWQRDGFSHGALIAKQLRVGHRDGALAMLGIIGDIVLHAGRRIVRGQRPFGLMMSAMLLKGAVRGLTMGLRLPLVGDGARAIFDPAPPSGLLGGPGYRR
jgi:hypothetical protein